MVEATNADAWPGRRSRALCVKPALKIEGAPTGKSGGA